MVWMLVRAAWVALLSLVLAAVSVHRAAAREDGWARLLSAGPGEVTSIVVAPGWPDERVILARRGDSIVRTRDDGASWEDLGAWPAENVTLTRFGGARIALAYGHGGVLRSTDDGATWKRVLPLDAQSAPRLALSPRFADDGRALLTFDDRLYLGAAGGADWVLAEPIPGQRVTQAGFWPGDGAGRDVFALVASQVYGTNGRLYRGGAGGWEPVAAVDGVSIDRVLRSEGGTTIVLLVDSFVDGASPAFVSPDGGATWAPFGGNLAVGDVRYDLASTAASHVSLPHGIAEGGAIFVAGFGGESRAMELFRTDDLGVTWTPLTGAPVLQTHQYQRVDHELVVSPRFATDRTVVLVQNSTQGSPTSGACSVSSSADGGITWEAGRPLARSRCDVSVQAGPSGVHLFVSSSTPGGVFRSRSTDGGRTWSSLMPGLDQVETLATSPSYERDATLFVGTRNGELWALGPDLVTTDGQVGCASEPVGGFGRVWSGEPGLRQRLGCPRGPEAAVRIREHRAGDRRALWIEDDRSEWYELTPTGDPRTYSTFSKTLDRGPWEAGPDRVVGGAVQDFAGGTLIFLPDEDGRRSIIHLDGRVYWREYPD